MNVFNDNCQSEVFSSTEYYLDTQIRQPLILNFKYILILLSE